MLTWGVYIVLWPTQMSANLIMVCCLLPPVKKYLSSLHLWMCMHLCSSQDNINNPCQIAIHGKFHARCESGRQLEHVTLDPRATRSQWQPRASVNNFHVGSGWRHSADYPSSRERAGPFLRQFLPDSNSLVRNLVARCLRRRFWSAAPWVAPSWSAL